ncbi:MAG: TFIIB-type zinc ribbon-containing protein, partial [Candidatus Thorarchaeota archaeon]
MMGFFGSVGLAIATRKERRWSKTMIAYLWMRKELLIEKRNNQFTYALTLIVALPLIAYAVLLEGWSPYLLILVGYAYVAAFFPVLIGDGLGRMISHVEATAEDIEMIRESERTATHHVRTCSECGREMLIPKEERGVTTCPNCGKRQVL